MGTVVSLQEYRERRERSRGPVDRLARAVDRLDGLVQTRTDRLTPTLERELRAIAEAVAADLPLEAADRAERLADLLEHPAAL
jgi:hypothetical protein